MKMIDYFIINMINIRPSKYENKRNFLHLNLIFHHEVNLFIKVEETNLATTKKLIKERFIKKYKNKIAQN
jgi:hypothetical protein